MQIKTSNIYCYYVKNHNAIKVGFGDSSVSRMRDYAKTYSLDVDIATLKTWQIPVSGLALSIENACHGALIEAGIHRHLIPNSDGKEAQELFFLGTTPYQEAVLLVAGTIDETIHFFSTKIVKSSHFNSEQSRRKAEENRVRKEAINAKKKEEFQILVSDCSQQIKNVWNSKFEPVASFRQTTRAINKNFDFTESFLKNIFRFERNTVKRFHNWNQYPRIREMVVNIFDAQREAKQELINIFKIYQNREVISKACDYTGLQIYSPGGFDLPFVDNPLYADEWAFIEVRLLIQEATYSLGGDEASELIKLDSTLQSLVKKAAQKKPPELTEPLWNRY